MRKRTFLFWMILLGWMSVGTHAQIYTIVTGNVSDEATGEPVPGQEVIIDADSLYTSSVYTNESGFYMDTILSNQILETVYIATLDLCSFVYHDTVVFNPPQGAVIVADFAICTDTLVGGDCQAAFTYYPDSANPINPPNMIQFVDQSTPAGNILSWSWSFGDGTGSSTQNPVHEYGSPGMYTVCLTIETTDSCSSTFCMDVIVGNLFGCQAAFYYFPDSLNPYTIQFVDQSSPSNQIVSWYWVFGENSVSTQQNPMYTFGEPGLYPVCLTITAFDGMDSCISTYCEDVFVGTLQECQASFYYTVDSTNPGVVNFIDMSVPENLITSWFWDFADGSSSSEQNPVHIYNGPGIYTVCLTIEAMTGEEPCTSTFCLDVFVQGGSTYSLGGNTFAGIYQLDEGFAYAYKVENGAYTDIYSQVIDTLGYYFFDLLAGDYYVKVEPTPNSVFFNDYLPTYYGDAIHWEDAELMTLNQNVFTADINLVPMSAGINGNGSISGYIFNGGEKSGNPATDIQIMLANAEGEYVGMVFSDDEGYFEFTDLANGMYTLYAEVVGKSITPESFYLSDDNPHVTEIVMTIGTSHIVFGVDELNSRYIDQVGEPYPNPVSGSLTMNIDVKEPTLLRFEILNLTGQTLLKRDFRLSMSGSVQLDTESLDAGFYLIKIETEDNVKIIRRFIRK